MNPANRYRSPLSLILPALGILGVIQTHSQAQEWSRFRGPNGSGVSDAKNLPSTIDTSNTVWKVTTGTGWSSPVAWKEKLFLTAESGAGKRSVVCLNMRDGKELWRHDVPFSEHHQNKLNNFASATPFVDESRVYVNWTNGNVVEALALDHTGKLLWHNTNIANYVHEHGSAASPVVADGVMIVRAEFSLDKGGKSLGTPEQLEWKSSIVGIDAATGQQKWKLEVPNTLNSYATPVVRDSGAGKHEFVLADSASGVMGIDTVTGKMNWQHNPGYKQRSVGSYVLKDDIFFATFGSGDGGKESALLKLGGDKPKELDAKIVKNIPYVPSPLLVGDRLYLLRDGGFLSCLKFPSGEEVYSAERLSAGGRSTKFFSSPIAADGKIYCCSSQGDVVVVKAGDKFEVLGTTHLDGPINSTPAIAGNHLFVRTETSLWCVGAKPRLP